jgi:hypothetical protein
MTPIPMFKYLDIETFSPCNRRCPTCIRNSHLQSTDESPWTKPYYLNMKIIRKALVQAMEMKFDGQVCLSHFNEPLMDPRLPEIAKLSHSYFYTFLNTNGDFLTEITASDLDGKLDKIIVSLYMDNPIKAERAEWIKTLFHRTEVVVNTETTHLTTHYSPRSELQSLIDMNIENNCVEPKLHCIINYAGYYHLCCEDMTGNFDLGRFPDISLEDYWFGPKHTGIINALKQGGGRRIFSYCSICPKG